MGVTTLFKSPCKTRRYYPINLIIVRGEIPRKTRLGLLFLKSQKNRVEKPILLTILTQILHQEYVF
mgnify:CR=1 FL=1